MHNIAWEMQPMTVRQVFYQMVTKNLVANTQNEYKNVVCRLLTEMRLDGDMPFRWLVDNTRWMRKPRTYSSLEAMLDISMRSYRRSLWADQDVYCEIWLEKDALSGVVYDVTDKYDVPLMVTRGYPSVSFLHDAAEIIADQDKPTYLYYFGDHDPSGVDIPRNVEERLDEFSDGAEIYFERIAVTPEQIIDMNLPTNPTKKTDTRSKSFGDRSVELDAIPPGDLRDLVEQCILQHIDGDKMKMNLVAEKSEREQLSYWKDALNAAPR